jgi:hypothetical protein
MDQAGKLKTISRVVSQVFLLVAMVGPWFADSHPATEQTCTHPLVWLGNGYCACLVSFKALVEAVILGQSTLWLLYLPPVLPILSTLLLLLIGERRLLWIGHLIAWGLVAIYSFFLFFGLWYSNKALFLWGAGFCGLLALTALVVEILAGRHPKINESPGSR